jgi:sugar lactone lactonase YvrE/lysophospholipase L1-like esterase
VLLSKPRGLALDRNGMPWVADSGNGLLVALGASGVVRTLSGAAASSTPFTSPWAAAFAADGSLWVADAGANVVRKLDATGATLLTLRGTEGGGDAFVEPMSVAVDGTGSVWVADSGNSVVRKFDAQGASLQTVARPGSNPRAVAIDPASGGMYVARTGANVVEAFNADGSSRAVWDGSVTGATPFSAPAGVTVDATGRVFVADTGNDIVQVFQHDGTWITTIRGSESGAARLDAPYGVAIDANGNLWVAEAGSNRVQAFGAATSSRARPAARIATTTPGATALNEFQYSGSASYLATQYDPNTPSLMVLYYKGSARWTLTYVFDPQSGLYISDATRSRIEGTRSKYYTDRNGGATLCDEPARLTDVSLLGTQRLTLTGLQDEIARAVLPLPTELLVGCDTAGPGVIFSAFYPPIGGTIPDFPPRMLPRGWEAKFPTAMLTTGSSQVLWQDKFKNTGRHERTISDGTKRIDIHTWTLNVVLSGVVPGAYVGLGDSYSAATGATPAGDLPCLRSPGSYVEMFDPRTPKNTVFAACSGGTAGSITSAFNGPPQADQVPYTADKISITVGGNDAGLFSVLKTCVLQGALPLPCSVMRPTALADAGCVAPKISGALTAIKAAAPSATVAILEYPNPFPDNNTTGCAGLRHPDVPLLGVRAFDVQFFHDLVVEVNKQVSTAATTSGATFVETANAFVGHDMCSTTPWFGPANGKPESFHPNDAGTAEMKKALDVIGAPR